MYNICIKNIYHVVYYIYQSIAINPQQIYNKLRRAIDPPTISRADKVTPLMINKLTPSVLTCCTMMFLETAVQTNPLSLQQQYIKK